MKIKAYLCKRETNIFMSKTETAKINSKGWNTKTDNPKLGCKMLADGRGSLFLLYNYGYNGVTGKTARKKEFLKLYLLSTPKTPVERQQNKQVLELAQKIKAERGQQFLEDKEGYRLKQKGTNLFVFFADFIDQSNVADKGVLRGALKNFQDFVSESYPQFSNRIEAKNLSKEMMDRFARYLEQHHRGEGKFTYWQRFKRLINFAVEKKVIRVSPCVGVKMAKTGDILSKDILSEDEVIKLFSTHYRQESELVRRAFAVTCFTGIRHCDLANLRWGNIDFANKTMTFRQAKVMNESNNSGVVVPLDDVSLAAIGEKPKDAKTTDFVFPNLPTIEGCNKVLRHWVKYAKIDKHITWHCGRHTFATLLLSNGANIKTVSQMLGHSTLRFTEKYVRAVDDLKRAAVESLPKINITKI